ncbi:MAG: 1-deoxy-D-xylulose-5-phosphate reductoisomerase [Thermoguttaceae bacterium]|nr:1-deoxy-D-xylulose-5-phosphate reductoisomerase [Thermoguttaceae bacterium]
MDDLEFLPSPSSPIPEAGKPSHRSNSASSGVNVSDLSEVSESVVVLGSTGSIGRSALDVIAASGGQLRPWALSAHRNVRLFAEQIARFRPRYAVLTSELAYHEFRKEHMSVLSANVKKESSDGINGTDWTSTTELLYGDEGIRQVVRDARTDIVLSAIVGIAGLAGTWEAVDAGKTVALANKESLVVGGDLITRRAAQSGSQILPVDSEHSAIFQALRCGKRSEVAKIWLTASGGPFYATPLEQLAAITPRQALAHPTWSMGPKVTIDSATLMNKALELIEARWLFGATAAELGVVIHPQSIVHSMVEYRDGSVIAQLGIPDMRLPIHHALYRAKRPESVARRLDWREMRRLEFYPPDAVKFPAISLGLQVIREGGVLGAVLNAANEVAVAAFLDQKISFQRIVPIVEKAVSTYTNRPVESLAQLAETDATVREEVLRWL